MKLIEYSDRYIERTFVPKAAKPSETIYITIGVLKDLKQDRFPGCLLRRQRSRRDIHATFRTRPVRSGILGRISWHSGGSRAGAALRIRPGGRMLHVLFQTWRSTVLVRMDIFIISKHTFQISYNISKINPIKSYYPFQPQRSCLG